MDKPTLYIIKHKMSGSVDEHDGITDNPEAWLIERNQRNKDEDFFEPESLDDFWVEELEVDYFNSSLLQN